MSYEIMRLLKALDETEADFERRLEAVCDLYERDAEVINISFVENPAGRELYKRNLEAWLVMRHRPQRSPQLGAQP